MPVPFSKVVLLPGMKWPHAAAMPHSELERSLSPPTIRPVPFPCPHWIHLRTTNPNESAFATVRRRHRKNSKQRHP